MIWFVLIIMLYAVIATLAAGRWYDRFHTEAKRHASSRATIINLKDVLEHKQAAYDRQFTLLEDTREIVRMQNRLLGFVPTRAKKPEILN